MNTFDHELFLHINSFARATGALHPLVKGWATYGIAVFAALMLMGWWRARRRNDSSVMAAALWAPLATVLAVTINQPIVALVAEPRPYTSITGISCWRTKVPTRRSLATTQSWRAQSRRLYSPSI